MNDSRFIDQQWPQNSDGLDSPLEQVATRRPKIRACQQRKGRVYCEYAFYQVIDKL